MRILVVVDVQNDFLPGGPLPVPDGDKIVPAVNALIKEAKAHDDYVVFTQDWHPVDHSSFVSNGGQWPMHCVEGTAGAEIYKGVNQSNFFLTVRKGTVQDVEQYSAVTREFVDLVHSIEYCDLVEFIVCGLATDYCVAATAINLKALGNKVTVKLDACRGVAAETTLKAMEEMLKAGVVLE